MESNAYAIRTGREKRNDFGRGFRTFVAGKKKTREASSTKVESGF
jgi:hypothetical protein